MKIKLIADKINGIIAVDSFENTNARIVNFGTFAESIKTLEDEIIGTEVEFHQYEMLKNEFGITDKREIRTVNALYRSEPVNVYYNQKKLMSYNNVKKEIVWNCQEVSEHASYVDFIEKGTIDDIELKLQTWNNPVKFIYATAMNYNASENDPGRRIWKKVVEAVKKNPDKFFFKNGNWKRNITFNDIKRYFGKPESI